MPFGGFENWEDCIGKITSSGKSQDSANNICGAIKARTEGTKFEGKLTSDELTIVKMATAKDGMIKYTIDEVRELCPSCVEKMEKMNLKEIVLPVSYFEKGGKVADKFQDGRPPKDWWDKCVAGVEKSGSAVDPAAVCGNLWHNVMHSENPEVPTEEVIFTEVKKFASMKSIDGVEIFRVGTWNGDSYDEKDLDNLVENFEKLKNKQAVPLKIGHSESQKELKKEGLPAAGWVTGLKRVGDRLVAMISDMPKKIFELVKRKAYKKVSAEIYPIYKDGEGNKYDKVLRAVALLGGEIPAVEGLSDVLSLYHGEGEQEFKAYSLDLDEPSKEKYDFSVEVPNISKYKFQIKGGG